MISEMSNHDGTVRAVRFLPGETGEPVRLASGGAGDGRVYLTDIESNAVLKYTQVYPSRFCLLQQKHEGRHVIDVFRFELLLE